MSDLLRVDVGGVSLGYCVHGAGSLPPLVFVHGYGGRSTSSSYDTLLELLAKQFTVYAVDMRGHGASAAVLEQWSIKALSTDIARFCSALNLVRPVFAGHSLGAYLGLAAEIDHPGTFSALCLVTPASPFGQRSPDEQVAFLVEHGQNEPSLRQMYRPIFTVPTETLIEEAVAATAVLSPTVHKLFFAEFATASIEAGIAEITAPALVLLGDKDVVVPIEAQQAIAARLQSYEEVRFSGQGHMLPAEAPELSAREILTFLDHDCLELAAQ